MRLSSTVDVVGMRMGMNCGLTVTLMPTMGCLWCLFAQVVALCVSTLPSHNPSGRGFESHTPHITPAQQRSYTQWYWSVAVCCLFDHGR